MKKTDISLGNCKYKHNHHFSQPRLPHFRSCSFHLSLGGDAALGVGDLDAEGLSLGEDVDALAGGDGVGDSICGN